jgi:hypothetical protein
VLKVDVNDDTILSADAGDVVTILSDTGVNIDDDGGTPHWNFDAANAEVTYDVFTTWLNNTADAADTGQLSLVGGGARTVFRGAIIDILGEQRTENGNTGGINYSSQQGTTGFHQFNSANANRVQIGPFANIEFLPNGFGSVACGEAVCDGVYLAGENLAAGIVPSAANGAYIGVFPNVADFTTDDGKVVYHAANVANGTHDFYTGSDVLQWRIENNGDLDNQADNNLAVADEVYGGSWDSSLDVPTKNAVFDKIENIAAATGAAIGVDYYDHTFTWPSGTTTSAPLATEVITHNVGRPPDKVIVWYDGTDGWREHHDFWRNTDSVMYGWNTWDTVSNENNITQVRLYTGQNALGAGADGIIRLYWITNDSVTASPSTGLKISPAAISANTHLLLASGTALSIDQGTAADKCAGKGATLNGTTAVTISTTCIQTNSIVLLTREGPPTTGGAIWYTNIVNGVSFDIDSDNASDDSNVSWLIINDD